MVAWNASLFLNAVLSIINGGIDISILAKISCEVAVIFDTDIIAEVGLQLTFVPSHSPNKIEKMC
jgi:hypothetical protein